MSTEDTKTLFRRWIAETLVCQVLQHYDADFQRPPLPPYDLRVVFAISAALPTAAHDTLRYIARNTYGMRILADRTRTTDHP
jgi:hypothetical protein